MIRLYCDASISPAEMINPLSSRITDRFIGRIVLLSSDSNYGYIEQVVEGVLTDKGNPGSQQLEVVAIKKGLEKSSRLSLDNYVVLSDNIVAVNAFDQDHVNYVPSGEFHPASAFLARVMRRAQYLRSSGRKVTSRVTPTPLQLELFRYFTATEMEFNLSESLLWKKIIAELQMSGSPTNFQYSKTNSQR